MPALKLTGAALFVAASALYGLTTLSASVPRWLVIYAWVCVISVGFAVYVWRWKPIAFDKIDLAAVAVCGWCALSLTWSFDRQQGFLEIVNLLSFLFVFLWVRRNPEWIPEAATLSLCIALALQFAYPEDWGGHGNRNFQTEAIIFLSALSLRSRGKLLALALATSLVAWSFLIFSNPSKIEFFVLAFLIVWWIFERRILAKLGARAS